MPSSRVPVWQNGTPQSMQRAPCLRSSMSSACSWNSDQWRTRSAGACTSGSSRGNSRNPVGLPIVATSQQRLRCPASERLRVDAQFAELGGEALGPLRPGQQQGAPAVPPAQPGCLEPAEWAAPDAEFDVEPGEGESPVLV